MYILELLNLGMEALKLALLQRFITALRSVIIVLIVVLEYVLVLD